LLQALANVVEVEMAEARHQKCDHLRETLLSAARPYSGAGNATSTSAGVSLRPNISNIVIQLFMRLWGLLHDPAIMGQSDRPASWLPTVETYMQKSTERIICMVTAIDEAVSDLLDEELSLVEQHPSAIARACAQATPTAAGQAPAAGEAALQPGQLQPPLRVHEDRIMAVENAVRQLAPLLPQVPWAQVKAAYSAVPCEFIAMHELQQVLCGAPLLRMVCLLALCGRLGPEQMEHLRGLLGRAAADAGCRASMGSSTIDSSTGDNSITPHGRGNFPSCHLQCGGRLQQPPDLSVPGLTQEQALQRLAQMMAAQQEYGPEGSKRTAALLRQVHQIFSSSGLQNVADLHVQLQAASSSDQEAQDGLFEKGSTADHLAVKQWEYMAWLQQGLLQVISEGMSSCSK
jgi:hypothetical protein